MAVPSSSDKKKYPFAPVTKARWLEAALPEWQGESMAGKSSSPEPGIVIAPYYDRSGLPEKINSVLPAALNSASGARAWLTMPLVAVTDDSRANEEALSLLNSGADGILFEPSPASDPRTLLSGLELNYCSVAFIAGPDTRTFLERFRTLLVERRYDPASINGAVFYPLPRDAAATVQTDFGTWSNFHAAGWIAPPSSSAIDLLTELLVAAAREIEKADRNGNSIGEALTNTAFMLPAGTDFFLEIAKLKTLRALWFQVSRSWAPEYNAGAFIHSVSEPWIQEAWQPHGNLLKSTTAAMSAILGGCDALTLRPEDDASPMMKRIAGNVSLVLSEEAHFSKVADPTAGSYLLENLIDQLSREVWKKFQEKI